MNKVTAVVVTYNRLEKLKKCIDSILKQEYPCDIIIVDNDSTDGTGEWVTDFIFAPEPLKPAVETDAPAGSEAPDEPVSVSTEASEEITAMAGMIITQAGPCRISYYNTQKNSGGAGGFNSGMKYACLTGYEYIWVMDDDAYPEPDALKELMDADTLLGGPGSYGYLGSVVLWTDGTECVMNRHAVQGDYYRYFDKLQNGILAAKYSTFVSLLFPADTVKKVGLPIKEYFIWGDDIEYTTRITQVHKMPSFVAGRSIVVHDMKSNVGSDISRDDYARLKNYGYAFRNENHMYRHRGFKGFIKYIMRCGINFLRLIAHAKDHRMKRFGVFFGAVFKGFFFNPKIEYLNDPGDDKPKDMPGVLQQDEPQSADASIS